MKISMIFTYLFTMLAALLWIAAPAAADPLFTKMDGDFVSLSGEISDTRVGGFTLDYDTGAITVEMDDWDAFDESTQLEVGERVTVYGVMDDALFERRTIEAGSVYVYDRGTFYHASSADEEGDYRHLSYINVYPYPVDGQWIHMSGKVKAIDGRIFTLVSGRNDMQIDTATMGYNPMDDEGYQKIEVGDRVSVWGHIDDTLFDQHKLMADTVITIDGAPRSDVRIGS